MTRRTARAALIALAAALPAFAQSAGANSDSVLRAMRDEMDRSRGLKVLTQEPPYFIQYRLEEGDNYEAAATLGGLIAVRHTRFSLPAVEVRVGDYKFDSTNYTGSGLRSGTHYAIGQFPLDDNYQVLRRDLWLATDSSYKSAVEAIARKRAALKNVTATDALNDFAKAEPVKRILEIGRGPVDEGNWAARVRELSAIFLGYPAVNASSVVVRATVGASYYMNSEGTEIRQPDNLVFVLARADAQAADGMLVHDAEVFESLDPGHLAAEPELRRGVAALAARVTQLAAAPKGTDYSGPVLFEGMAAAQLFAEVLGHNLALTRRPVAEPGRPALVAPSELEGRQGARILPDFFDVVDDPTQKEWQGRPLFGSYAVDEEGVVPRPVQVVEKGVLKAFLLTRQPVTGYEGSNGRARMPGSFGAEAAGISNLFVRARETAPPAELKKKLIEICKQRNKPYGTIVRRMDFPSSASYPELRRLLGNSAEEGSGGHPVSAPLLVYRLYPDGREELVRGLRFRGLNARSLKDILAAGDDNNFFDFLNSQAPMAMIGGASYVAESCTIAPSVLIDDLELHPVEGEMPKLPVVPAPDMHAPVSASR
jgi:TldD protein